MWRRVPCPRPRRACPPTVRCGNNDRAVRLGGQPGPGVIGRNVNLALNNTLVVDGLLQWSNRVLIREEFTVVGKDVVSLLAVGAMLTVMVPGGAADHPPGGLPNVDVIVVCSLEELESEQGVTYVPLAPFPEDCDIIGIGLGWLVLVIDEGAGHGENGGG